MARQSAVKILQRYKELQDIVAILGMDELAEEEKLIVSRAFKMSQDAADLLQKKNTTIEMSCISAFTNNDFLQKIISEDRPMVRLTPR